LYYNKEKLLETSLKDFSKNINEIIKKAKKYSSEIIFLGLIPVDEEKVNPTPWRTEVSYGNYFVKAFNSRLKILSTENKVRFVDLFRAFGSKNYKELLEDGVHPNSKGHEKIFLVVKNFLKTNSNI
jgi:lysophospholipase L1-like esterase